LWPEPRQFFSRRPIIKPAKVLIDFDGTITLSDSVDALLSTFASPEWLIVEQDWEEGLIGSAECMSRQARLIRGKPEDLNRFIDSVELDDAARDVVEVCRAAGIVFAIASDGYDIVIDGVLERLGIACPSFSNTLRPCGADRWELLSPHAQASCRSRAGTCKCALAEAGGAIVIGDGKSDFCVAERAEHVFAKGRLAQHCRERGISHTEITCLGEIVEPLAAMLRQASTAAQASMEYR
jgi:2-hydroxy-3-keto-5-methylthiopentenyl-1-phosphate phosphatase